MRAALKWEGYIYFHNGGKFDFRYLLPLLPKRALVVKSVKGRMASIRVGRVEFRDSFLLLPVALDAYEKEKIDYKLFEPDVREAHREKILRYLRSDLINLHHFVTDFVEEYGFGLTLAGRTFHILKKQFGMEPPKFSEKHDARFRPFYYGGRVEFRALGKLTGPWTMLDINSAYPRAMIEAHWFGGDYLVRTKLPKNIGPCFVHFRGQGGGALPWRSVSGSVLFPLDEREFFVTGWEYLAAWDTGKLKVKEILTVYQPEDCRSFRAYVEYFYRQKADAAAAGDKTAELFNKLILNSLYGRFALNPREFRDVELREYGDMSLAADGWEVGRDFEEAGLTLWEKKTPVRENSFFNVCTAASITGWVRAYLWRSLCAVSRPVYCDTDSIICRGPGKLKQGKGLGEWKVEAQGPRLWVAGKKLYALKLAREFWKPDKKTGKILKWKKACKGVNLSAEEICRVAEGTPNTSTRDVPTFSLYSEDHFVTRTVRRDDQRKKR